FCLLDVVQPLVRQGRVGQILESLNGLDESGSHLLDHRGKGLRCKILLPAETVSFQLVGIPGTLGVILREDTRTNYGPVPSGLDNQLENVAAHVGANYASLFRLAFVI